MSTYKCKMCGGDLHIEENATTAVCEYCGTMQTVPKLDTEKKINLYDRANHFRRSNDYDSASRIYNQILNEDTTDSEAYWSLVLCRYGVEYVEDPDTHKRIPTVNRAQFTSIFADEDYKCALKYADVVQKKIYEEEAKAIDEIQKGILKISQKEKPFDVFICYKETDADGRRTRDSVLATELYHELTKEGLKVFFSRITLEDKLGTAYEPYIFAALNSSKIMVVIGTKKEYFNAVWVKNEWSRYLSLIENGADKVLIPAYRDMDPYDLPEEFSYLQAQDMSKLGFMQDLSSGIHKIINHNGHDDNLNVNEEKSSIQQEYNYNLKAILKRGHMALEDKEYDRAEHFFDSALNYDAECAEAYFGQKLAELHLTSIEDLVIERKKIADDVTPVEINAVNYKLEVIDSAIVKFSRYNAISKEKIRNKLFLDTRYLSYKSAYQKVLNNEKEFWENDKLINKALKYAKGEYKELLLSSQNEVLNFLQSKIDEAKIKDDNRIEYIRRSYGEHVDRVCIELQKEIDEIINERYDSYCRREHNSVTPLQYKQLAEDFEHLNGYKDSNERANQCLQKEQKLYEQYTIAKAKKKKLWKIIILIFSVILIFSIAISLLYKFFIMPSSKYSRGEKLLFENRYSEALDEFEQIDGYKDSKEKISQAHYGIGMELFDENKFEEALLEFEKSKDYGNSQEKILEAHYNIGNRFLANNQNNSAFLEFNQAKDYLDANKKASELKPDIYSRNSIASGLYHTLALQKDGKVLAIGRNNYGQCDVSNWENIISVCAGAYHSVGLKSDGTVVAVGYNLVGQCEVSSWTDIVAISAGGYYTVGLKSDGTVVAVGQNSAHQCDVSEWRDIKSISAKQNGTIGITSDNTIVTTLKMNYAQNIFSSFSDLLLISNGYSYCVGIKSNGKLVTVGSNTYGQCDVKSWEDIIFVSTSPNYVVGLKTDGAILITGLHKNIDVSGWTNIVEISSGYNHIVGLKSDGTLIASGDDEYGQCLVSNFKNVGLPELKK